MILVLIIEDQFLIQGEETTFISGGIPFQVGTTGFNLPLVIL